jgi:hypothetical protein
LPRSYAASWPFPKRHCDRAHHAVACLLHRASPADASAARPKLRYQDIPDLPETFADSIGQWIFDAQVLRVKFTVTRLDPGGTPEARTGRRLPAARMVLTPRLRGRIDPPVPETPRWAGKGGGDASGSNRQGGGAIRLIPATSDMESVDRCCHHSGAPRNARTHKLKGLLRSERQHRA